MDIAPKYNLIAVAKNGNNAAEQIVLKSAQDAKVGSTKVKVTLPDAFKGQKVYINHDNKELYVAKAKADGTVEFTTNGFSPFTFALSNPNVVAEVNGNAYKSLQDAAKAAKEDSLSAQADEQDPESFDTEVKEETTVTEKYDDVERIIAEAEEAAFQLTEDF